MKMFIFANPTIGDDLSSENYSVIASSKTEAIGLVAAFIKEDQFPTADDLTVEDLVSEVSNYHCEELALDKSEVGVVNFWFNENKQLDFGAMFAMYTALKEGKS
jgi:hypothetical protein